MFLPISLRAVGISHAHMLGLPAFNFGLRLTLPTRFLANRVRFLFLPVKNRTPASTRGLNRARKQSMVSRITISLALVAAIFVVSEGSTMASCNLPYAQNQKSCASPCCVKHPCCETSQKRTQDPVQPFSTANAVQKNFVALTAIVPSGKVEQPRASEISSFSLVEHLRHSPETLALLCIRLI